MAYTDGTLLILRRCSRKYLSVVGDLSRAYEEKEGPKNIKRCVAVS